MGKEPGSLTNPSVYLSCDCCVGVHLNFFVCVCVWRETSGLEWTCAFEVNYLISHTA